MDRAVRIEDLGDIGVAPDILALDLDHPVFVVENIVPERVIDEIGLFQNADPMRVISHAADRPAREVLLLHGCHRRVLVGVIIIALRRHSLVVRRRDRGPVAIVVPVRVGIQGRGTCSRPVRFGKSERVIRTFFPGDPLIHRDRECLIGEVLAYVVKHGLGGGVPDLVAVALDRRTVGPIEGRQTREAILVNRAAGQHHSASARNRALLGKRKVRIIIRGHSGRHIGFHDRGTVIVPVIAVIGDGTVLVLDVIHPAAAVKIGRGHMDHFRRGPRIRQGVIIDRNKIVAGIVINAVALQNAGRPLDRIHANHPAILQGRNLHVPFHAIEVDLPDDPFTSLAYLKTLHGPVNRAAIGSVRPARPIGHRLAFGKLIAFKRPVREGHGLAIGQMHRRTILSRLNACHGRITLVIERPDSTAQAGPETLDLIRIFRIILEEDINDRQLQGFGKKLEFRHRDRPELGNFRLKLREINVRIIAIDRRRFRHVHTYRDTAGIQRILCSRITQDQAHEGVHPLTWAVRALLLEISADVITDHVQGHGGKHVALIGELVQRGIPQGSKSRRHRGHGIDISPHRRIPFGLKSRLISCRGVN